MFGSDDTKTEENTDQTEAKEEKKASNGKNKNSTAKKSDAKKTDSKKSDTKKGKTDNKKSDAKKSDAKKDKTKAKDSKPKEKKPKAELDKFGFRKGSKKSAAAALYAGKKGATLAEIKEKTGSSQLNLLSELEEKGYTVSKTKETGKGKKQVTRYKIEGEGSTSNGSKTKKESKTKNESKPKKDTKSKAKGSEK